MTNIDYIMQMEAANMGREFHSLNGLLGGVISAKAHKQSVLRSLLKKLISSCLGHNVKLNYNCKL